MNLKRRPRHATFAISRASYSGDMLAPGAVPPMKFTVSDGREKTQNSQKKKRVYARIWRSIRGIAICVLCVFFAARLNPQLQG
jgi:hypothetical protein